MIEDLKDIVFLNVVMAIVSMMATVFHKESDTLTYSEALLTAETQIGSGAR